MATTQDAFRKELERRFRKLRGVLRETIVENDALKLPVERVNVEPARDFKFVERSREEAFREWWDRQVEEGFLEPLPSGAVRRGEHYSASYVRRVEEQCVAEGRTRWSPYD